MKVKFEKSGEIIDTTGCELVNLNKGSHQLTLTLVRNENVYIKIDGEWVAYEKFCNDIAAVTTEYSVSKNRAPYHKDFPNYTGLFLRKNSGIIDIYDGEFDDLRINPHKHIVCFKKIAHETEFKDENGNFLKPTYES